MRDVELSEVTEFDVLRDVNEEGSRAKGLGGVVLPNN